jgi:hypothetical protein
LAPITADQHVARCCDDALAKVGSAAGRQFLQVGVLA